MNKQKKIFTSLILFFSLLLSSSQVFAIDYMKAELSKEFMQYLELSDQEKANTVMPRSYNVEDTSAIVKNPLRLVQMARSTSLPDYTLKEFIPENLVVKNQMLTNSCWTFSSLAVLESTLALKDYKYRMANNKENEDAIIYDFSERHMEYATSQSFVDGPNPIGFNRYVGVGGNFNIFLPYLTNGMGAIPENEMQFKNSEAKINLIDIADKSVVTQVNDAVTFPSYSSSDDKTAIIQKMKEHIQNYGAIDAVLHGASVFGSNCYNNQTASLYCNHSITSSGQPHAVAIIGWDDTWGTEKFIKTPTNPGAWIIKNSWGTEYVRYTLEQMKEMLFEDMPDYCAENGWTEATQISDEFAKTKFSENGYEIENDEAVIYNGDKGFMYVSYEDYNIYLQLSGIIDAQAELDYENIYQYNEYGSNVKWGEETNKMYLASVFDKKTDGKEYLTQVSINAPETYTCKVYVDVDGTDKSSINNLTQVQLKTGESETFDAGYHTIEFAEPIKIESDSFLVVLEVEGTQSNLITALFEANPKISWNKSTIWNNVTIQKEKNFISFGDTFSNETWMDTSKLAELTEGNMVDADITLKAFSTSKVLESLSIENSPQTIYVEGQDFDTTGMIVNANYANGDIIDVTDEIIIQNGENLTLGQTEVIIIYEGVSINQKITVEENVIESIVVKSKPENTEYWAGENFDATGMTIEASYKNGTRQLVTNYSIPDSEALKNNQTTVTIEYAGKTVTQEITVKTNVVIGLKITKYQYKTKYVVGQNFEPADMIVIAKYAKGNEVEIKNYTIKDGNNLQITQTSVTIEYEEKTVLTPISVEEKAVTGIALESLPIKNEYIQNKEDLDLAGGSIQISYNDDTKEVMAMTSKEITVTGFDNKVAGKQTLKVIYQGYEISFEIEVKELAKPQNSDFSNIQGNVNSVRGYYFTDENKKAYIIIDVELNDIKKFTANDKVEYSYYISSNVNEKNIVNWVKISDFTEKEGKLAFEINTSDISNYEEVSDAENLYLYIKEIATRNDMTSEAISVATILQVENITIEEYLDGKKKTEIKSGSITNTTPGEEPDNTTAQEIIPNAGKSMIMIFVVLIILVIGRIAYLKYKDIQI